MKAKIILYIFIPLFFLSCQESKSSKQGFKIIDLKAFEIEVPEGWEYKKEQGFDSFVGRIIGDSINLSFDYSEMGYANSLIMSKEDYFENWKSKSYMNPYLQMTTDTFYTSIDLEKATEKIKQDIGIRDSTKFKVVQIDTSLQQKIIQKGQKYIGVRMYRDTTYQAEINIPEEILNHSFAIDTIGRYRRKIIKPKQGKKGLTGVYFKDLKSDFNFQMSVYDLSLQNQKKAINAFKSIKIKR